MRKEPITGYLKEDYLPDGESILLKEGSHILDPFGVGCDNRIFTKIVRIQPGSPCPKQVADVIFKAVSLSEYGDDHLHLHLHIVLEDQPDISQKELYAITRYINDNFGIHDFAGGRFIRASTYYLKNSKFISLAFELGTMPKIPVLI